jgi:hypothetical protein
MNDVHIGVGVIAIALSTVAAAWGGWCWLRASSSRAFWGVLRAAQLAVVVEAALGGVLLLIGRKAPTLHYVYGLLPLAVSLIGEQLRISAAVMVLDARGLESAQAVGTLPEQEQREIVVAIVRREVGVMALAALMMVVLLARAAMTGG